MSKNIEMLAKVARGLGELRNDMVFVGGSVAELYANDPAASDIRPTLDVDCVVEVSTRVAYYELETMLRAKGFCNDTTRGAPLCRWIFDDVIVDVMPIDEAILGFSNRWYKGGVEHKVEKQLPDGSLIWIFPAPYYLGAKFEAMHARGDRDLRTSHDFEDIIYILDNTLGILDQIEATEPILRTYLSNEFTSLLAYPHIVEAIECALPYGSSGRVRHLTNLLSQPQTPPHTT